jgi:hypothetical protein
MPVLSARRIAGSRRRAERWSMGFTLDTLADGGAFRTSMQDLHALVPHEPPPATTG